MSSTVNKRIPIGRDPKGKDQPHPPAPPLVDRMLIFFYVMMWANFLWLIYHAFDSSRADDRAFLLPVGVYALFLLLYFAYNLRIYRRTGGQISDLLWGFDNAEWIPYAYILISYALGFWLTASNNGFWPLHFSMWAGTMGMFRWRVALPLVSADILLVLYQVGVVAALINGKQDTDALIFIIYLAVFLLYAAIIAMLLRSRIDSERLVQELQETKLRLEDALQKEAEVAVLRERNRMAREMHDVLGHALALVAVKIEAAQRLQAVDPKRAAGELDATKELVRESMAELRASLAELRGPAFAANARPLREALSEAAAQMAQQGGFSFDVSVDAAVEAALPPPVQDAVWRVAREALLNVARHARAGHVELNLFAQDDKLYLSVRDDGSGIPRLADGSARLDVPGHYGLRGMRERLAALGGTLTLRPGPDGKGTLLLAAVPLIPISQPPAERLRERLTNGTGAELAKEPR